MTPIFVVQTNNGYYINTVSFHATKFGAEWDCAHRMHELIEDDNKFEADDLQIIEEKLIL